MSTGFILPTLGISGPQASTALVPVQNKVSTTVKKAVPDVFETVTKKGLSKKGKTGLILGGIALAMTALSYLFANGNFNILGNRKY